MDWSDGMSYAEERLRGLARHTRPIVPPGADLDWFRSMTTNRLKQMWDHEDYEVHCDEIHHAMNERGHGEYVAV